MISSLFFIHDPKNLVSFSSLTGIPVISEDDFCMKPFLCHHPHSKTSSANKRTFNTLDSSVISIMSMLKSSGPSTDPWGSPHVPVFMFYLLFGQTASCLMTSHLVKKSNIQD